MGAEKMQGGKQRHSHPPCMCGVGQGGRLPAWVTRQIVVSSLQDGMPEEEQVGVGDTELMSSATPPPTSRGAGDGQPDTKFPQSGLGWGQRAEVGGDRNQVWA